MKRLILSAALIGTLAGCETTPIDNDVFEKNYNRLSYEKSNFDNSEHVRVTNMTCQNQIGFELYQDTLKSKKGRVLLTAGTNRIENIGNENSLVMKIDGEKYHFKPISNITNYDKLYHTYGYTTPFSSKKYILKEDIVRKIASSKEFMVRIKLLSNEYREAECSLVTAENFPDVPQKDIDLTNKYIAIEGFKKFVSEIDKVFGKD